MDKKKQAIDDEKLEQVTGGFELSDNYCSKSPNEQHCFEEDEGGIYKCKYCGVIGIGWTCMG